MDYSDIIKLCSKDNNNSFYLIDGRIYIKHNLDTFFEVIDNKILNYHFKGGDLIHYKDLDYTEEAIYLPTKELVWHYLLTRHKK